MSEPPRRFCQAGCRRECLRQNVFLLLLISGVAAGIGLGVGLRYAKPSWTARELFYYKFPGEMLMRMLQMMILPLIITSMISGMSSLGQNASSRIGLRAIIFYLCTTLIATITGIVLVITVQPGTYNASNRMQHNNIVRQIVAADSLLDLIRNALPENIVDACIRKAQTGRKKVTGLSNATEVQAYDVPEVKLYEGTNLLGVIVFSLAFGIALNSIAERGRVAREFFNGCSEAALVLVKFIIWFTPIGIIFLISGKIIEMKNVAETLSQLGLYAATVITGLVLHGFIVLPLIYLAIVRRNPFRYMFGCLGALLTAVSTSSSSATLPVTLYCIEEINGVSRQVSRFVLPFGATINMDGTALYEAVAAVFIAQVNGITWTLPSSSLSV